MKRPVFVVLALVLAMVSACKSPVSSGGGASGNGRGDSTPGVFQLNPDNLGTVTDYSGGLIPSPAIVRNSGLQDVRLRRVGRVGAAGGDYMDLGSVMPSNTGYDIELAFDFPVSMKMNGIFPDKTFVKVYFTGLWQNPKGYFYANNMPIASPFLDFDLPDGNLYHFKISPIGRLQGDSLTGKMVSGTVSFEILDGGIFKKDSGESLGTLRVDHALSFRKSGSEQVLTRSPVLGVSGFEDPSEKVLKALYNVHIQELDASKIKLDGVSVPAGNVRLQTRRIPFGNHGHYVSEVEVSLKDLATLPAHQYEVRFEKGAFRSDAGFFLKEERWSFLNGNSVRFSSSSRAIAENASDPSIGWVLDYPAAADMSFKVEVRNENDPSNRLGAAEYAIRIARGQKEGSFPIDVRNNSVIHHNSAMKLVMTDGSPGLQFGAVKEMDLEIYEDDMAVLKLENTSAYAPALGIAEGNYYTARAVLDKPLAFDLVFTIYRSPSRPRTRIFRVGGVPVTQFRIPAGNTSLDFEIGTETTADDEGLESTVYHNVHAYPGSDREPRRRRKVRVPGGDRYYEGVRFEAGTGILMRYKEN